MGKRRLRFSGVWLERGAFLVLLAVVGGLLLASTQVGKDDNEGSSNAAVREFRLTSGPVTMAAGEPEIVPATSSEGRRRDRIRVVVPAAIQVTGNDPVSLRRALRLEYSDRRVLPDASAEGAGVIALDEPLRPGTVHRGELRFEIGGRDTRALRDRDDARLTLEAPDGDRSSVTVPVDVPSRSS